MRKSRVLIISNPLNHEGGIVNYYNLFFNNFKSNEFEIVHFSIGSRAWLFYYPTLKKVLYLFYLKKLEIACLFKNVFNFKLKIYLKKDNKIGLKMQLKNNDLKHWLKFLKIIKKK